MYLSLRQEQRPDCIVSASNERRMKPEEHIIHPFGPYVPGNASILILGSFPSVKSREQMFFYGHPQNRFWRVLAALLSSAVPETIEEKKRLLDRYGIALWDVIGSCTIRGSADASITDVMPNDIAPILRDHSIGRIYVNGKTAARFYNRYQKPVLGCEAIVLPSTSPANAQYSLEKLIFEWSVIISHAEQSG